MFPVQEFFQKHWRSPWFAVAAILFLALPLLFLGLNGYGFIDPDEGRYGSIPRQMLLHHDFVTPTQNSIKFFDKPPLLYWLIAASYSVFGFHEWAARLVPALAALAGLFAAYGLGRRMFGPRAGLLSALVLATSLLWPLLGRVVITDMLVSSLVFCALALWWLGHSETSQNRQTGYFLGFWVVLACGVLAKGPIAVVLVGGSLFFYFAVCKQWRALKTMRFSLGVPLFFLIAAPWYVLVAQRNPEFNHFFWYDQHIARFMGRTTGNDHVQGISYYLKFLPIILFPWSLLVPAAIAAAWQQRHRFAGQKRLEEKPRAVLFLLCAFAFVMLFFSASSGKIVTYILPVVPVLALLLGIYFDWLLARSVSSNRIWSGGVTLLCVLLFAGGVAVAEILPRQLDNSALAASRLLSFVLIIWAVGLAWFAWKWKVRGAIAGAAGGFIALFCVTLPLASSVAREMSAAPLMQSIRPGLDRPNAKVLSIGTFKIHAKTRKRGYIQSLEFYARRRVVMIGSSDEMSFGIAHMKPQERRVWVFEGAREVPATRAAMLETSPVYGFVRASKKDRAAVESYLKVVGNGAVIIAANARYVVFGNRAAVAITPPQTK